MKKSLFIAVCVSAISVAFTQTYNLRERYDLLSASHSSMAVYNSSVYTVGYTSDSSSPLDPMSYFVKHDIDGTFQTKTIFKIPGYMQTATSENSLLVTADKNLACVGYGIDSLNSTKVLFVKYDSSGNVLFYKTYSATGTKRFFGRRLIETNNGFYIQGTVQYSNFDVNVFLMKIDAAGNEHWRRFYGLGSMNEQASAFIKTSGNRLMIAAQRDNRDISNPETFESYMYLLLLDTAGNIVRDTVGTDPNVSIPQSLIETQDGNFIFCTGYAVYKNNWTGTDGKGYLAKVDSNLNILWERLYGDSSPVSIFYHLVELASKELIVVGSNYNQLLNPYHNNGIIVKTDEHGNLLWSREYRGASRTGSSLEKNELYDSEILSDGSIIACGVAQLYSTGDTFPQQAWLLRIDANGCMDNNWCGYTGVDDLKQASHFNSIQLLPNPTRENVRVQFPEDMRNGEIKMYDITGRLILQKTIENEQMNLVVSLLHKGLYILIAEKQSERIIGKLIIE